MRARNIKPAFFRHEDLAEMPAEARLLFIGLWCMADREGRLEDRPKKIKLEILPYDDLDIEKIIDHLANAKLIIRYSVEGKKYISIPRFLKHQKPHQNEKASIIPPPEDRTDKQDLGKENLLPRKQVLATKETSEYNQGITHFALNPECGILNPECGILNPDSPTPLRGETPSESCQQSTVDDRKQLPQGGNGKMPSCPHQEIIQAYHAILPELTQIREWTPERQKLLRCRWKERKERQCLSWWEDYFHSVREQPWLMGENDKGWTADLEWLVRPKNMPKVIECKYKSRDGPALDGKLSKQGQTTARNLAVWLERKQKGE